MVSHVYAIRHKASGKMYIGKSKHVEKRLRQHRYKFGKCVYIKRAIVKHCTDAFEDEILCQSNDDDIGDLEKYYIEFYNTRVPNGYNLSAGGEGGPLHEVTKAKIAEHHQRVNDFAQYNKQGHLLAVHNTAVDAARSIPAATSKLAHQNITAACRNGRIKSAYGFMWRYVKLGETAAQNITPLKWKHECDYFQRKTHRTIA